MREITRICEKAGIVCGTGTAAMMPDFFERWGERDTAYMMYGVGRAAFAGWQAWNLAFGDSVSNQRIAEVERMLRNDFTFKWFAIQRVGGRVMFIMTLKVSKKAYNVAPPNSGPTPTPTSDEWLWFEMPSGGTVTLTRVGSPTAVTLEVSLDNGQTWTTWTESGTTRTQTLAAGQVMHIRNQSSVATGFSTGTSSYYIFSTTAVAEVGGDVDSLLCSDPSIVDDIPSYAFYMLFNSCDIKSSPLMPAATIHGSSYHRMYRYCTLLVNVRSLDVVNVTGFAAMRGMFQGCTALESIPLLKGTAISQSGYREMFSGCSSLEEIRTMMTDISASQALSGWVNGVAATGNFYCPQALTIPTGADGIPTGWTRHDI